MKTKNLFFIKMSAVDKKTHMHRFSNQSIAKILSEMAVYLEMDNIPFKPRAFEKVALTIEGLQKEVADIYMSGGLKALEEIPGIGKGIAERIEELFKTGSIKDYEKLKRRMPIDVPGLTAIEGLGPKHVKALYRKLGIRTVAELEMAAKNGKIRKLSGFGERSEEKILKGIEFLKKSGGRFVLGLIIPEVDKIKDRLEKIKEVERIDIAGSIRRGKETIGDADILVVSKQPKAVMDFFVSMPEVENVVSHGKTKSAVRLKSGLAVDIRVVPRESYGAALNYFTGSKDHNVTLREIAVKKRRKLNEYGLYRQMAKGKLQMIAGGEEEEIYEKLGMSYIPPELREMTGEIEAAQKRQLPQLIKHGDLRGDLQVQTSWTDGANTILEMALAAEKAGLQYIAIADHTKRLAMTHGLDEKRIQLQWREIDEVNNKLKAHGSKFIVLRGTECDILPDGSLDLPDKILEKIDVVGVSVHSRFNMSKNDQTERLKRAMSNRHVDILFHPTGRVIQSREPYAIDVDEIVAHAKKTRTVLEIDAYPTRVDLKDEHIRKCVEAGVLMAIDSDAHSASHFEYLKYGVIQARRGWAGAKDIVNTRSLTEMLKLLKK